MRRFLRTPRLLGPIALAWIAPAWIALGLLSAGSAVARDVARDVDTFHLRLFEDGVELAADGRYGEAVQKLRLACFGMLDRPDMLAPCLGRLLVSQDAAEAPADELETTVDRLLEVERRFQGWTEPYARFAPSDELRRRVDVLFARFGTAERLSRIPGLGDVALERQAAELAALPLDERRRQLNVLVQQQKAVPLWHVMSAELSLEAGEPRAAASAAAEILRTFAGEPTARCVLGRARAAQGQCGDEVIEDLEMCPANHRDRAAIDRALLECLVASERWAEADLAWQRLPASIRDERPVRRLRREIEKNLDVSGGGGSASSDDAPVYAPPPGLEEKEKEKEKEVEEADEAAPQPSSSEFAGLPDDDRETLRRVRDALATEERSLYDELWAPARKVAKRHDGSAAAQRLAGSLAFRLGKWRDAIRFLRSDPSLPSTRPQLQLELAVALHYQGQGDEAREEFARCRSRLAPSAWLDFWADELGV